MKRRHPMRGTILFGLACALMFGPSVYIWSFGLPWRLIFGLTIWSYLAAYALLLCRWSGAPARQSILPLLVGLTAVFWADHPAGLLMVSAAVLAWIRSGLCFQGRVLSRIATEVLVTGGGIALGAFFAPNGILTWSLGIWSFFLIQSFYFIVFQETGRAVVSEAPADPFERARRGAEAILSGRF